METLNDSKFEKIKKYVKTNEVRDLITQIKNIRLRMNQSDLKDKEFIHVYTVLCDEFKDFSDRYVDIFMKVLRKEDIKVLAACLLYLDQVKLGIRTEEELRDKLGNKFIPAETRTLLEGNSSNTQ